MKVVYYSFTNNTKRFVNKLDVKAVSLDEYVKDEKFILITPTYNIGQVPEDVQHFLNYNWYNLVGVIATGNKNWGQTYGLAGNKIAERYDVPLLHKLELGGNSKDVEIVNNIIKQGEFICE